MKTRFLLLLTAFVIDCAPLSSTIIIQPSDSYSYRHRPLEVRTHDGRLIRFTANTVRIVEREDGIELEGKGTLYREKGIYVGRPFEGKIAEAEIEQIAVLRQWDPLWHGGLLLLCCLVIPLAYYGI